MKRLLFGSLEDIAPPSLLRLVSATSASGILELESEYGLLRLEVDRGRVRIPDGDELRLARLVLSSRSGDFRFKPADVGRLQGRVLSLSEYVAVVATTAGGSAAGSSRTPELDRSAQLMEVAEIHVLPAAPLEDPLGDLVTDLATEVPPELLSANLAVIAQDPRPWRGSLEREWRQRGWRVELLPFAADVDLTGFDLVIVHHQQAVGRSGQEQAWIELVRRASASEPPLPVIWVAQLGASEWIHRLIDAGVAFLMPAPQGDTGEAMSRFLAGMTRVADRQLQIHRGRRGSGLSTSASELVEALLSDGDPDEGVRSLLSLAAEKFSRGAVLMVASTVVRSRAGFGYPLNRNLTTIPRGGGLLERVIRSGEAVMEIDPSSGDACRLAEVCGVSELPVATALIPLGRLGAVAGVLVADRRGETLPEIDELVVLAGRLGGAALS
jgi:hypothetical protein